MSIHAYHRVDRGYKILLSIEGFYNKKKGYLFPYKTKNLISMQGSYAAIPPPMYQNNMVQQNERGYQNRGYGNQNYGNNRGGGRGGGHHGAGGYNRNEPKFVHTRGGGHHGGQWGNRGGQHGGQWGHGGDYGNPSRNWNQHQQQRNYNSNHGGGYGNSSNYRGRNN